jgi:pyruvate kinase
MKAKGRPTGAVPAPLSGIVDLTTEAMVDAACLAAGRLDAPVIVVATHSGRTALALSNRRPAATVVALTRTEQVARVLALCWGVTPLVAPERLQAEEEIPFAIDWALKRNLVQSGQQVVLLRGEMPGRARHRAVVAGRVP